MIVPTYVAYLLISVGLTVWVARTLHKNGRIFLVDSFLGNEPLADSVNHLLVVGFYLINIGYVTLALKYGVVAITVQEALEMACQQADDQRHRRGDQGSAELPAGPQGFLHPDNRAS